MKYINSLLFSLGCLLILLLFTGQTGSAQNLGPAVEQWRSFLPYYQVRALAYDENSKTIYCATDYGFFSYNLDDGSLEPYSKVNGMHDIGMSDVAFDEKTGYILLAYNNGNIDLFKNNSFSNIPDLKNSQISGDKTIYAATCNDGIGYLSSGVGLILINLSKKEVKVTVPFYSGSVFARVNDAVVADGQVYTATSVGLFQTNANNPFIQNYSGWKKQSQKHFKHLGYSNDRLYAALADSVFVYRQSDSSFHFFYLAPEEVTHLDGAINGLWVSSHEASLRGHGYLLDDNAQIIDSVPCHSPAQIMTIPGEGIWYADQSDYRFPNDYGLRKKLSPTESKSYTPQGPVSASSFDISAYNGMIWVAHGGYNNAWIGSGNRAMFSVFKDNQWKNFNWLSANSWVQDFIRILYDPVSQHAFAGSLTGGLIDISPDMSIQNYAAGSLPLTYGGSDLYSVSGLDLDQSGNLWISSNGGSHELTVKTSDGEWYPMKPVLSNTGGALPHSAADVVVDDYGQAWFRSTAGNGLIVYNDNGTPGNTNDDRYRTLRQGEGNGNLPSNDVLCLAKTKDGAIWVGTSNGIGIINCPGQVIDNQCETSLTPVKFDEFAGEHLFVRQAVSAIAVDADNRKWLGTGNGVWLLGSDGNNYKIIYRFTTDNSPLPSNNIQRINIDPVTGDVYFSTDKGFIAFRSTATEPDETAKSNILIYPNPVPSGYHGMIAVRGLPNSADVRFTDISGKLVYKTTALGGQAVWNGSDYTGHKVQSGVYLVFVVSKDRSKKETAKLIIQK